MENESAVIATCRITSMKTMFDPTPKVIVTTEDEPEVEIELFRFYPDEISFTENEFIGLTLSEAKTLKFTKDKEFLQS